ncbi:MAG: phosphoribosylglycinamide formyltransferase [Flavobacteriaceae bacterium]|nr:phosphoribosylglycinamide formyltransferase [Flavobacteriaceae bacterium]
MKKIVIFASGSGTNAENIVLYFKKIEDAKVIYIFSNNANAKVIERAKKLNIPSEVFSKEDFNRDKVLQKLNNLQPNLIILAGFLLKFPQNCVAAFPNKIINIHPALLPKYGGKGMFGMNVHRAVVENNEPETGITIHYVNENYDEGNIIFQKSVPLSGNETPEDIAAKVYKLEKKWFPKIIENILKSKI